MTASSRIPWLGAGVTVFAGFLFAVAIPYGVSAPSNIQTIVLSPKFWPITISLGLALLGVLMILGQLFFGSAGEDSAQDGDGDTAATTSEGASGPWIRLLAMAGLMVALILAIPKIGMVWAAMACFALFAVIVRTPRPIASLIVAVLLPLFLYGFFNHIAGVAVPQGEYVRLP